jgi:hypothetical protein
MALCPVRCALPAAWTAISTRAVLPWHRCWGLFGYQSLQEWRATVRGWMPVQGSRQAQRGRMGAGVGASRRPDYRTQCANGGRGLAMRVQVFPGASDTGRAGCGHRQHKTTAQQCAQGLQRVGAWPSRLRGGRAAGAGGRAPGRPTGLAPAADAPRSAGSLGAGSKGFWRRGVLAGAHSGMGLTMLVRGTPMRYCGRGGGGAGGGGSLGMRSRQGRRAGGTAAQPVASCRRTQPLKHLPPPWLPSQLPPCLPHNPPSPLPPSSPPGRCSQSWLTRCWSAPRR